MSITEGHNRAILFVQVALYAPTRMVSWQWGRTRSLHTAFVLLQYKFLVGVLMLGFSSRKTNIDCLAHGCSGTFQCVNNVQPCIKQMSGKTDERKTFPMLFAMYAGWIILSSSCITTKRPMYFILWSKTCLGSMIHSKYMVMWACMRIDLYIKE